MKRTNLLLLGCAILALSSCAISTTIPSLEKNYNARMVSTKELAAKTNIKIFLSEKDVPYDYTVLALVKYKPLVIPPFVMERGKMDRKFYKKAVLKAADLGGDAIIVQGMGQCKVISHVGEEDSVHTGQNMSVINNFKDGTINTLSQKEKSRYVNALKNEIENEIKVCKTREALGVVSDKVDTLEKFLVSDGQKTKVIETYKKNLSEIDAKLTKKENRANKRDELKAKVKGVADNVKEKAQKK